MLEQSPHPLDGFRVLLVEDEYVIAADLAYMLEEVGIVVIGPAASVSDAIELIRAHENELDGAILDINLGHERVFPVADVLIASNIPFVFATGYSRAVVPDRYSTFPRYEKPVDRDLLLRGLLRAEAD